MSIASLIEKILTHENWEPIVGRISIVSGRFLSPENRELLVMWVEVFVFIVAVGLFARWLWGALVPKAQHPPHQSSSGENAIERGTQLKKARFNGWQRLGIVASILWAICGGLWINSVVMHGETGPAERQLVSCLSSDVTDFSPCYAKFDVEFSEATKNHLWYVPILGGLLPIPMAWLLFWGIFATLRWIRAGFD